MLEYRHNLQLPFDRPLPSKEHAPMAWDNDMMREQKDEQIMEKSKI